MNFKRRSIVQYIGVLPELPRQRLFFLTPNSILHVVVSEGRAWT